MVAMEIISDICGETIHHKDSEVKRKVLIINGFLFCENCLIKILSVKYQSIDW